MCCSRAVGSCIAAKLIHDVEPNPGPRKTKTVDDYVNENSAWAYLKEDGCVGCKVCPKYSKEPGKFVAKAIKDHLGSKTHAAGGVRSNEKTIEDRASERNSREGCPGLYAVKGDAIRCTRCNVDLHENGHWNGTFSAHAETESHRVKRPRISNNCPLEEAVELLNGDQEFLKINDDGTLLCSCGAVLADQKNAAKHLRDSVNHGGPLAVLDQALPAPHSQRMWFRPCPSDATKIKCGCSPVPIVASISAVDSHIREKHGAFVGNGNIAEMLKKAREVNGEVTARQILADMANPAQNPHAAQLKFLEGSAAFEVAKYKLGLISAEEATDTANEEAEKEMHRVVMEKFHCAELGVCAACGTREIVSELKLELMPLGALSGLRLESDRPRYKKIDRLYREERTRKYIAAFRLVAALAHVEGDDVVECDYTEQPYGGGAPQLHWYALDGQLRSADGTFPICAACLAVNRGENAKNHHCFVNGWDFGVPSRIANFPELTLMESIATRAELHFQQLIKIKGEHHSGDFFRGHLISFRSEAPTNLQLFNADQQAPQIHLPLPPEELVKAVRVVYCGNVGEDKVRVILSSLLSIDVGRVIEVLKFYKATNDYYAQNVHIVDDSGLQDRYRIVGRDIIDGALRLGDVETVADVVADEAHRAYQDIPAGAGDVQATTADHATGDGTPHGVAGAAPRVVLEDVFLDTPQPDIAPDPARNAARNFADFVAAGQNGDQVPPEERRPSNIGAVVAGTVDFRNPTNEFADAEGQLARSMPHLFSTIDIGTFRKLGEHAIRYLVRQHDSKFSSDAMFAFLLWDQLQRHKVAQQTAVKVKKNAATARVIEEILSDPDLPRKLQLAELQPDSPESRKLCDKLSRVLVDVTKDIPFSPAMRKACLAELTALVYYSGMPSLFLTVSPADMNFRLTLRRAGLPDNHMELPNFASERYRTVVRHAAFAADSFDRLMRLIFNEVIKVVADTKSVKTSARVADGPGIFGRIKSHYTVVEAQGRGTLHAHGLLWGGLNPSFMEAMLSPNSRGGVEAAVKLRHCFAAALDKVATTFTPLAPVNGPGNRLPPEPGTASANNHINDTVLQAQIHQHTASCYKKDGETCRFCMPAPPVPETKLAVIDLKTSKLSLLDDNVTMEQPVSKPFGYPLVEQAIIFAQKRDAHECSTSGYNKTLTLLTGSNTAVVPITTASAALSSVFYIIKYITKNQFNNANVVSLFRAAVNFSRTAAGIDDEHNKHHAEQLNDDKKAMTIKQIINRFSNKHLGAIEISQQMALAGLMGLPSEYKSDAFTRVHGGAALTYVKRLIASKSAPQDNNDNDDHDDDGEEDCDDVCDDGEDEGKPQLPNGNRIGAGKLPDAADDDDSGVGVVTRDELGTLVVTDDATNYAHRGDDLASLSLYFYVALVAVKPKGAEDEPFEPRRTGAGRPHSATFAFDRAHPLHTSHHQVLRSKQLIPALMGHIPRVSANSDDLIARLSLRAFEKESVAVLQEFKSNPEMVAGQDHLGRYLSREAFLSLLGSAWLESGIIDHLLHHLATKHGCYAALSSYSFCAEHGFYAFQNFPKDEVPPPRIGMVFVPVIFRHHWTLLVEHTIDNATVYRHYDSLDRCEDNDEAWTRRRDILVKIIALLNLRRGGWRPSEQEPQPAIDVDAEPADTLAPQRRRVEPHDMSRFEEFYNPVRDVAIERVKVTQQPNPNDCGAHVLVNAELLMLGESLDVSENFVFERVREVLLVRALRPDANLSMLDLAWLRPDVADANDRVKKHNDPSNLRHAQYMSAMFRPWSARSIPKDLMTTSGWRAFLESLRASDDPYRLTTLQIIYNVAQGLTTPNPIRDAFQKWRRSNVAKTTGPPQHVVEKVAKAANVDESLVDAMLKRELQALDSLVAKTAEEMAESMRQNQLLSAQLGVTDIAASVQKVNIDAGLIARLDRNVLVLKELQLERSNGRGAMSRIAAMVPPPGVAADRPLGRSGMSLAEAMRAAEDRAAALEAFLKSEFNNILQEQQVQLTDAQQSVVRSIVTAALEAADGKSIPKIVVVHGGPGTGKSVTIRALRSIVAKAFSSFSALLLAAPSAVAAINIDGETLHSVAQLHISQNILKREGEVAGAMRDAKVLIIDEMSMVGKKLFAKARLHIQTFRRTVATDDPNNFGGLLIVLVGDFFQLRPVQDFPLFLDTLPSLRVEFHQLTEQQRCSGDDYHSRVHRWMIEQLRGDSVSVAAVLNHLFSERFLNDHSIGPSRQLLPEDKIVVATNEHRAMVNFHRACNFAREKGKIVIAFWMGDERVPTDELDHSQWFYFVEGAPAIFNTNLFKELGMVNGQMCRLVSAVARSARTYQLVREKGPQPAGSVLRIPSAPHGIVVKFATRQGPEERIFVECKTPSQVRNDQSRGYGKSKQKQNNDADRHELSIELGFCFTFHKVQGITTDRIVLDLLNKPVGRDNSSKLSALYVALTRVKSGRGVLLLPPRTNDSIDSIKNRFMKAVKIDKDLHLFLKKFKFPVPAFCSPPDPPTAEQRPDHQ